MPSELVRKHVWMSTGEFFFVSSFLATLDAFEADRIVHSTDNSFGFLERARKFLERLPIEDDVLQKVAHKNADGLLKLVQ